MFTVASSRGCSKWEQPNDSTESSRQSGKYHDRMCSTREGTTPCDCEKHQAEREPGKKTTQDLLYDSSLKQLSNSLPCPTAMEARVAAAEPKYSRKWEQGDSLEWWQCSDNNVEVRDCQDFIKYLWGTLYAIPKPHKICKPWWNWCMLKG